MDLQMNDYILIQTRFGSKSWEEARSLASPRSLLPITTRKLKEEEKKII